MDNNQTSSALVLSIVGHTNTGKTSLVRTLLRDSKFGDVDNTSGTTRHVEAAALTASTFTIELRDTPGLEDSNALYEALEGLNTGLANGRKTLEEFIDNVEYAIEFEQELKVIRQILICDAMLYVIDCREPVLEKYLFELKCLSMAARPIIPILNFIGTDQNQKHAWRTTLANLNLHAVVEFDTIAFSFEAEKRLYQKLQTVMEHHHNNLDIFIEERAQNWQNLKDACIKTMAAMLVNVACVVLVVKKGQALAIAASELQKNVREQERKCLLDLLSLLRFSENEVAFVNLPVKNNSWNIDLFSPQALKVFGVDTASAAATGAAVGAGIDLVLAGMSLGAASLLGAALGVSFGTTKKYGKNLLSKLKGEQKICLDANTLKLLLARQTLLLNALFQRGHAAQVKIVMDQTAHQSDAPKADPIIKKLTRLQNVVASQNRNLVNETESDIIRWLGNAF